MRTLYPLFLLALSACFNPDLSRVTLTCVAGRDICPDNLVCTGGICVDPNADLSASLADLLPAGPDLAPIAGCSTGTGYPVGDAVVACPGSFKAGEAASLCAAGYAPCVSAPRLDTAACKKLQGFFIANVVGRYPTAKNLAAVVCTGNDFYRVVFGCGNPIAGRTAATSCGSFSQLVDCEDRSSDFKCPIGPFEGITGMSNPFPLDGVLCCHL